MLEGDSRASSNYNDRQRVVCQPDIVLAYIFGAPNSIRFVRQKTRAKIFHSQPREHSTDTFMSVHLCTYMIDNTGIPFFKEL